MLITTYQDEQAITIKQGEEATIQAVQDRAFELAFSYDVEAYKISKTLGVCYLTSARKTKAGVNATYRNETAILKAAANA